MLNPARIAFGATHWPATFLPLLVAAINGAAAHEPAASSDSSDLDAINDALGVPTGKRSCHTADVGGYFVEGHVPATDVERLLAERTTVKGLTVPGMPPGSPGMEVPDGSVEPHVVRAGGN